MNIQKVVDELKRLYPEKNIILNDPESPTEIYCEIEPAEWNPDKNRTIVVFNGKLTHPHGFRKQSYKVIKGALELTKEGKTYFLTEGQTLAEGLDDFHMAVGHEAWVEVTSEPAWSPGVEMPFDEPTV